MAVAVDLYESVQGRGRDDLVIAHMGMVKRVALHLKARLPPFMEVDELVQVGMLGLIEAARGFDASKGIGFENYAHSRVRGAIIDEVRRLSALPRSAVSFNKSHSAATQSLAAELGRTPTQAEMAAHMGMDDGGPGLERGVGAVDLFRDGDRHGGVVGLARDRAGDGDADDARFHERFRLGPG